MKTCKEVHALEYSTYKPNHSKNDNAGIRDGRGADSGRVELYPYPYPFSKVIPIPIPIPIGFFGFAGFIRVYIERAKCHPYSTHICIHGIFD